LLNSSRRKNLEVYKKRLIGVGGSEKKKEKGEKKL
jgi:hypothetical protein